MATNVLPVSRLSNVCDNAHIVLQIVLCKMTAISEISKVDRVVGGTTNIIKLEDS